jgi:hypothetical protein
MIPSKYEELLRQIAFHGEIPAQEFAVKAARKNNDYTDFYGLAAMLHSGYISTDCKTESGGEETHGTLGKDMQETAVSLCQFALPLGETFTFNECPRKSWQDFPVKVFITGTGLLKIEELNQRTEAKRQKRFDYVVTILIAIFAAIIGGLATNYLTPQYLALQGQNKTQANDIKSKLPL